MCVALRYIALRLRTYESFEEKTGNVPREETEKFLPEVWM